MKVIKDKNFDKHPVNISWLIEDVKVEMERQSKLKQEEK